MSMYAVNEIVIDRVTVDSVTVDRVTVDRVTDSPVTDRAGPELRLVPPPVSSLKRTCRAVYWRRRLAVLLVAVTVVVAAKAMAGWSPARPEPAPSSAAPPAMAHASQAPYLVKQGDTLWKIGRAMQPRGDVRPLVDRLAALRRGEPLRVGERIALP